MQKVVSISLNGIAFQLEEPGFNELRDYLERAEARLEGSPDRAEIMADLEHAIGEKCARVLGPHKTVVSAAEVTSILTEMGPVESAEEKPADATFIPGSATNGGASATGPAGSPLPPRKRLFKIREGEMWGGVCNGIAAYIGVDVTWVRIAAVLLTLFTSGVVLLVYFGLVFIVPYAETSEDRAAAFGAPFSTAEFIGRAKKKPDDSREYHRWRREWRRQQKHWQRQWDHMNAQMRQVAATAAPQMSNTARAISAVFLPIAALIGAVLFVAFALGLIELIAEHSIFGWHLPHGVPMWLAVIGLVMAYFIAAQVVRAIRHGGAPQAGRHPGWAALHTVLWVGFTVFLLWVAYTFIPGIRETTDQLLWAANLTLENLSETID
jgi:phage shock protein PspC (stress-responsive transcriptional regulator)